MRRSEKFLFGLSSSIIGVVACVRANEVGVWSFGLLVMGMTVALAAPLPVSDKGHRWAGSITLGLGVGLAVNDVEFAFTMAIIAMSLLIVGFPARTVAEAGAEPRSRRS